MNRILRQILQVILRLASDRRRKQILKGLKLIVSEYESHYSGEEWQMGQIEEARLLLNREELLKKLAKPGMHICEVGVAEGEFAKRIYEICQPEKLHLVDKWEEYEKQTVRDRFHDEIANGQIELHQGDSVAVSDAFDERYFDLIYIDSDHSYDLTSRELEAYASKLKDGGIIAGHDFVTGNWNKHLQYGVIEATIEFCKKNDWKLIYLTAEQGTHASFALAKSSYWAP